MAQWIAHQPATWNAAGSISDQGTCLGCEPGFQLGVCERQPINISLSHVSLFLPLFLLKTNKLKKKKEKKNGQNLDQTIPDVGLAPRLFIYLRQPIPFTV